VKILALNFDVREIRIIPNDGQPLFCLADVCGVLNISRTSSLLRISDERNGALNPVGVHKIRIHTNGGIQKLTFVNEENLYHVLIRSRKPKSREFQDWVAKEALPATRKIGGVA